MRNKRKLYITYFALFCAFVLATISTVEAKTFTVTVNVDLKDTNPGDGVCGAAFATCTLRAAIEEANAFPGADTIEFAPAFHAPNAPRTITLGLKELTISSSLTVNGPGARQLTIDGALKDRVMRIVSLPGNPNTVAISGLTIQNGQNGQSNSAGGGAGIYVDRTNLTLQAVTVRNNKGKWNSGQIGDTDGGGIRSFASQVTITDSTISDNFTEHQGGGIHSAGGGVLYIYNSTISGNQAMMGGGGICQKDNGVIRNTTIVKNQGWQQAGGGIWLENADAQNGWNYIGNTIVANNGAAVAWDLYGKFNSLGNNLVKYRGNNPASYIAADLPDGTDPQLGLLKNNGGQTDTHALLAGSPAIDAGSDCIALGSTCTGRFGYDQRGFGFARKYGSSVDVGAVEYFPIGIDPVIIGGKLFKSNGRGLSRTLVTLTAPDGTMRMVETDAKGRFSFEGVETGKAYVLKVENSFEEQYEPQTVLVTEARDNVNFLPF